MSFVEVKNVSKTFVTKSRKVQAVKNVSLSINKGQTYGLIGESGSGKSTLGFIISLLQKADSGSIFFDNQKIQKLKGQDLQNFRKRVQIIFQNPYASLTPKMTIEQIIEEPLIIHKIGKTKKERKALVNEMRTMCGLDTSVLTKYPSELSGGQRQRVCIASSMIIKPDFVILDEAVSSLDVIIQAQILNLLKQMQKSFNLTYLFISHNLNVVSYIADQIGVMKDGQIIEQESTEKIISFPKEEYTKKLFNSALKIN